MKRKLSLLARYVLVGLCLLLPVISGCSCTPHEPGATKVGVIEAPAPEYVLVLGIDTSGSMSRMLDDGRMWGAIDALLKGFFRERMHEDDRIVLCTISANPQGPIFNGSPKEFRKRFGSGAQFAQFMHEFGNSSRVFDSIREGVEYATPMLSKGRATCCVISDLIDNQSEPGGEAKLVQALAEFGRKGGSVGLYYVDFRLKPRWDAALKGKVPNFVVTSDIDANVPLPNFE